LQKIVLLKKIISILLLLLFLSACKSKSNIVTSKEVAKERGMYSPPKSKKVVVKTNTPKKSTAKKAARKSRRKKKKKHDDFDENTNYLVEQLINTVSDNLGVRYKYGGTTRSGFDCSGLIYVAFKKYDINLPRTSINMSKTGRKLRNNEIQKGDLVFFKTSRRNVINHVGMVIETNDDEILFIHTSTQKGVIISSIKEPYYKKRFAQANRVL